MSRGAQDDVSGSLIPLLLSWWRVVAALFYFRRLSRRSFALRGRNRRLLGCARLFRATDRANGHHSHYQNRADDALHLSLLRLGPTAAAKPASRPTSFMFTATLVALRVPTMLIRRTPADRRIVFQIRPYSELTALTRKNVAAVQKMVASVPPVRFHPCAQPWAVKISDAR